MIHTFAWLVWLAACLTALLLTRNPFYLLLILLSTLFVSLWLQKSSVNGAPVINPLRFTLILVGVGAVFNALTSHYGATVLFTIPGELPLLSGNVTAEALVYGATNGLILAGMFASFSVLNQALPINSLVRLIPRAYYPVALVTSIAVTYLPATLRLSRQIREAQEVRGHQVKGLRDWLPLLMPLLVGGMERAMQLAEAMTARGYLGSLTPAASPAPARGGLSYGVWRVKRASPRLALLLGVCLLSIGWVWRLGGGDGFGLALLLGGALLILAVLWRQGRKSPRTTYRRQPWHWQDSVVVFFALLLLFVFLRFPLDYSPYPALTLPPFDPLVGLAILGLLVPVVVSSLNRATKYHENP